MPQLLEHESGWEWNNKSIGDVIATVLDFYGTGLSNNSFSDTRNLRC